MAESGLPFRSLSDIAEQIRRKDVSPVEVTRTALQRLEHLNPRLNAFMTILGEPALEAAKRAEEDLVAGRPRGPLHGVPLALKDIFAMRGVQVTGGSQVLGQWIPDYDATVVARLKAAGAIFVGTLKRITTRLCGRFRRSSLASVCACEGRSPMSLTMFSRGREFAARSRGHGPTYRVSRRGAAS